MPTCLIGLGSNLGDRAALIAQALDMLRAQPGISNLRSSTLHETRPIGGVTEQPAYLNAVAVFECSLAAEQLFARARQIEQALGRVRNERWAARSIDLDLLLFGEEVIDSRELTVPHPRMAFRRFVIEPAAEVAPELVHPRIGWSLDRLRCHLATAEPYVALIGPAEQARALTLAAAEATAARPILDPAAGDAASVASADSPQLARHLELLERRAGALLRSCWPADGTPAISDFDLEQCLVEAWEALAPADFERYRAQFHHGAAQVVLPKLRVVLDTPLQTGARLQAQRVVAACRPGQGPFLRLTATEFATQSSEIVAAIRAMESL